MIRQIIEIADTGAFLSVNNHLLTIKLPNGATHTTPVAELECLILGNPALTITGALLSELAEKNVAVVVSSANRMPMGMMLPLEANYIQTERFHHQFNSPEPLRKRIWQAIVKRKIIAQGELLLELHNNDFGLIKLSSHVRSGDPDNMEARAAVIYWKNLFDVPFRRERVILDNNALLNYGYAVLRAMTARAVCAAGLHPAIGVEHHNRYDAFCLADDLMEPFRPLVDRAVYELNPGNQSPTELTKEVRKHLIGALQGEVPFGQEYWKLSDVLWKNASQIAKAFSEQKLPDNIF